VCQLGGGTDLALEAADGVGVRQAILADDLQGDDAAEAPVAGLEDFSHAALAEPLQEDIGAEDEVVALQELVGLVRRQPAALEKGPGPGFWARGNGP